MEVSAFADEEDVEMEEEKQRAEDLKKARREELEQRQEMTEKFAKLNLDTKAITYFYKALFNGDKDGFWNSMATTVEIIRTQQEQVPDEPYKQLMYLRGILLLLMDEYLPQVQGQEVALMVCSTLNQILAPFTTPEKRTVPELRNHPPCL